MDTTSQCSKCFDLESLTPTQGASESAETDTIHRGREVSRIVPEAVYLGLSSSLAQVLKAHRHSILVVIIQFGGCSQALPLLRPLACQVNDSRKLLLVTYQEQRLSS
jgi:hypothetical protein